ncbi:MAG: alpha-1,4-glucan--maltose-1-phosphate maltosyltransferase [Bryobacteraceae bacterium]
MEFGQRRVVIEGVKPEVDCGRHPIKRVVGERVVVEADAFTDGHDALSCIVLFRKQGEKTWQETPMSFLVNDRWRGTFEVLDLGRYEYTVQGWVDHFLSWRRDLLKRIQAGQDLPIDYMTGAELVHQASKRASGADAEWLRQRAEMLRKEIGASEKQQLGTDDILEQIMARYPDRRQATTYSQELIVVVDSRKARFSSWYEMFPRSTSPEPGKHGTFRDCEGLLPYVASMGFDVLYLPPIHPIGRAFRKGKNNTTTPEPDDFGSPWAIGGREGGHKSIHPELGTMEDFRRLVSKAREYRIDVALDIAFQASPDHPYVSEHPEWFRRRPDGTIQYAENPPKKYQDIYPFDFETEQWKELWTELKDVFLFWIDKGVRIFRVDNPHTKPFQFWEWLIASVKKDYPDVIFLSEAFTRPKVMYRLAKLGYTQSYTYFPWRNTKEELTSYLTELTQTGVREFFGPNQWPNTPDILTEYLQTGGRPAFLSRFFLAATLGANYGIYGPAFELTQCVPVRPGSEEYLDSEKYQLRSWNLGRPDSLREIITIVNRIRHENPALQSDWGLVFHPVTNDQLICYSKQTDDLTNLVIVVVNLDPHHKQTGFVDLPLEKLGIDPHLSYQVHDLLTNARYIWNGPRNYVELDPHSIPAHIFSVRRRLRTEREFEYFL